MRKVIIFRTSSIFCVPPAYNIQKKVFNKKNLYIFLYEMTKYFTTHATFKTWIIIFEINLFTYNVFFRFVHDTFVIKYYFFANVIKKAPFNASAELSFPLVSFVDPRLRYGSTNQNREEITYYPHLYQNFPTIRSSYWMGI